MYRLKITGAALVLVTVLLVSLFPMASLAEESEELVAYYPFDGDYQDHSGNGNHATYQSGFFSSGASGLGLSLNGDDQYISVPVNINPSAMPQVTITLWALTNSIDLYGTVISHDNYEWDRSICIDNRDGKTVTDNLSWSAYCGLNTGVLRSAPTPVTVGEWVFLAGVWDQDAGIVRLYVNGSVFETTGTCGTGLNYVYIGKNSTASNTHFNGIIDEVRIYNYALNQSEVNDVRDSVSPPPSLLPATTCDIVGEWQWFDGSTVYVSSNGTFKGGVPHDTGTWRATGGMTYDFTWSRSVDKLTISADCQRLDGKNQYGTIVWGTRNSGQDSVPPGSTCDIVGEWKWFNGGTVDISGGGTLIGINGETQLPGTWRDTSGMTGNMTYELTWSSGYVDNLTISADCQRLDGKNQYGTIVWGTRISGQDNAGTIAGTITDATTGQPLSGATIYIADTPEATTGSNGTYVLKNVPAGPTIVTASKSGYTSQNQSVDLIANTSETLDFALGHGYSPPATPGPAVSETGLIAYYPFNDDTQDHSGSGNHATNNGTVFVSGYSGQALNFDGSDDYVYSPVNINPEVMPQVTMIAWVKPDTDIGMTVISHDNGGFDRTIDIDNRGGGYGWSAFAGSGGVLGYHPVAVDTWTYLAVSYDQDTGIVRLYVNDEVYEKSGSLGSGWDYLHIGANPSFGDNFSGAIDEVRIYSYALSESQIGTIRDEGGIPGTPVPTTTPSPSGPTLTFESRSKTKGSTVQVPVTLSGVQERVGNMDITLSYNPSILTATEVIKGSLTGNSIFDYNIQNGTILISLADNQGFSGNGSVAYVKFDVIGTEGSTSPLDIFDLAANRSSDMAAMNISALDGVFTVLGVDDEEAIADCNGDGKLSVLDALCALKMAVGKEDVDLAMDVNGDGRITSLDARKILRVALGLETL